ncbi:hypothetical protein ACJDU8_20850 [Clostridium sp. WILCCON 0269]|uniref:Uncharacterized protein n=1 Tax=Candidatus Clostridium eludens TaxID=3381663 RepID=A0ABW8SS67_9CLOT
MLRNILMFLFNKSQSRIEMWLFIIVTVLFINGKVKQGITALLGGGLVIALIEVYLKI